MQKKTKRRLIVGTITAGILILAVAIALSVFFFYHPTHWKFNDRFVIGSSMEEIIEKYGPFNIIGFNNVEADERYYLEHDHDLSHYELSEITSIGYTVRERTWGFWTEKPAIIYEIYFENGDGIATRVSLREGTLL